MIPGFSYRRRFSDLSEKEILALAISSEEDDASIYRSYAENLKKSIPNAIVKEGLAIRGSKIKESDSNIKEWLSKVF